MAACRSKGSGGNGAKLDVARLTGTEAVLLAMRHVLTCVRPRVSEKMPFRSWSLDAFEGQSQFVRSAGC
jgi:hypothetical protein